MDDTQNTLRAVRAALSTLRIPAVPGEYDLHRMIARAFEEAGLCARHEARLGPRCRVDFLVGDVGVEVKRGAVSPAPLRAQALRYLQTPQLSALVLVCNRGVNLPAQLNGKPLYVFGLNRLWGVSLP